MPRKTFFRTYNIYYKGCFNEAAARCRGKRSQPLRGVWSVMCASMRPRPDAAENGHAPRPLREDLVLLQ